MEIITLNRKVLEKNDETAQSIREMLRTRKILTINMMSAPGSGKTSIIEKTVENMSGSSVAVITGDVQTANDAERLTACGIPVVQLITCGACHLDSTMIQGALDKLDLTAVDVLFIENIGNLICPAGFDLGENLRVIVLSTAEGTDKPLKYPAMFEKADAVVINKIDLLENVNFSLEEAKRFIHELNPAVPVFEISCTSEKGIEQWCAWLLKNLKKYPVLA
ncbi:hydrogenase nickel incorporation protein HypB [candidate division KSB1 bacterium]